MGMCFVQSAFPKYQTNNSPNSFYSYWFVLAWLAVTFIGVLVFYKIEKQPTPDAEAGDATSDAASTTTGAGSALEEKVVA